MTDNLNQEHIYTKKSIDQIFKTVSFVLIFALLATAIFLGLNRERLPKINPLSRVSDFELAHFQSQAEMQQYLENVPAPAVSRFALDMPAESLSAASPKYYSETNVQVAGIDEPDIVKTNGQKIFVSTQNPIYHIMERGFEPAVDTQVYPPINTPESKTSIYNAFPPDSLNLDSDIETAGELLLNKNILIVSNERNLTGFDISDSQSPKEIWDIDFDDSQINTLRLKDGQLYAVLKKNINRQRPCPIPLLQSNGKQVEIACSQIYYPTTPTAVDTTYSVIKINPENGQASDPISFVGSNSNSVVYMSNNALYITNQNELSTELSELNFLLSDGSKLLPQNYKDRLSRLYALGISDQAKSTEVNVILDEFRMSLTEDQALKFSNDFQNLFSKYLSQQMRKLQTTNITKVDLKNLKVLATGQIPGALLNQFGMDEYDEILRIATTIGGRSMPGVESANDIYTLDQNLKQIGVISDLGLDEQIYAARFIDKKAYLVTFKQIDPFYIIDLSDPENPRKMGELKIPGYSSYLHPLADNVILGIGKEDQFVKLTLFDTNQDTPVELDTYITDTYWSEALNNHRAFSIDPQGNTFFLPTGQGGLVFSYQNNILSLEQAVSGVNLKRAIYIDDYLYVVGDEMIVVLNKNDWEIVSELDLR